MSPRFGGHNLCSSFFQAFLSGHLLRDIPGVHEISSFKNNISVLTDLKKLMVWS